MVRGKGVKWGKVHHISMGVMMWGNHGIQYGLPFCLGVSLLWCHSVRLDIIHLDYAVSLLYFGGGIFRHLFSSRGRFGEGCVWYLPI